AEPNASSVQAPAQSRGAAPVSGGAAPAPAAPVPPAAKGPAGQPGAATDSRSADVATAPADAGAPHSAHAPSAQPAPAGQAAPAAHVAPSAQAAQAAPPARPASGAQPAALRARAPDLAPFFRGAGIKASVPPEQVDAFLFSVGQVVRAMIVNLTESLHQLAQQKSTLKLASTGSDEDDDNPLKLSAGYQETFANLFLRESASQVPPVDAVRDAFEDLQLHQQLVPKAVRSALDAFLARLDPEELEHKFTRGRGNVLLNAANRLKYWDLYKDLYDVVA